ncbi:Alanyl-tRNA editing protein Aarsd1 [Linnemannia gamsii]|uniref:Alanyl-tRNA editing protein Aarsd1 n=1 Tax=Linnemannia gamsii TaxID=64522 RepID=A0A9P6UI98_9FUNG|nr:Alanyl-tRNA editing protein Aarsd1 [Linnemannia gamsii]
MHTDAPTTTQVPVGLLTCQHTPYLRQFNTTVLSCSKKPNKQKLYEVQLQDTILFPEGGGQPCDYGTINESIEVKNVQRVGTSHIHHTTTPIEEGIEARLEVDWKRRFDHMQQHSGQHLVSALFEQPEYGCDTLAWGMNATRCHVELSKSPTPEQVQEVEDRLNLYIRRNYPIHVTFTDERPATLPNDYVGPNGVFRIVEIMQDLDAIAAEEDPLNLIPKEKGGLVRLDYNPCCGTHVKSLKDLQCIKLLHQEKIRGNNSRLYFVVGQRALDLLQETYQVIKDLAPVLSAPGGPETYVDKVIKTQKAGRDAVKQVKNLLKEVAAYQVRDWVAELKEKNPITTLEDGKSTASAPYLIKYHRDDVDMDFLGVITALLTDNDVIQGQRIFMLSAGEKKEGGPMIIIGQSDEAIKKIATEVSKLIDIKGGGKGRWQGKAKSWQGLDSAWLAAEALVHA